MIGKRSSVFGAMLARPLARPPGGPLAAGAVRGGQPVDSPPPAGGWAAGFGQAALAGLAGVAGRLPGGFLPARLIENQVGNIRGRFFMPRLRAKNRDELNAWLLVPCVSYAKAHGHAESTRTAPDPPAAARSRLLPRGQYRKPIRGQHSRPIDIRAAVLSYRLDWHVTAGP